MTQPTTAHQHMLSAALAYAAQGRFIVPLHAPLFDADGSLAGCSCEAHKRSAGYKAWLESKGKGHKFDPAFKCRTPGKHPRLHDWEAEASIDPTVIRAWFAKWPQLNTGLAAGKSGLLVLDADKYKDTYAGRDLLSLADQQTATALTGNGGQHLYYQMPPGATYGNQNSTLPDGIDIRGHGGMVVVYPSIHPTGNPYQWEDGYSLLEMTPQPLPQTLVALLDAACAAAPAQAITFCAEPTQAPPDLSQWRVSKRILDLIFQPAPVGARSESDHSVCLSLVYAGATDDDILAVFEHHPIGTNGKFAERGPSYLALTIGKARSYALANPRPDVARTVENLRLWIRTNSFEPFIGATFKPSNGIYYNDATDTRVADALLDLMQDAGRLDVIVGKKRLGALAGVGCNTAMRALDRLNGWLFDVTPSTLGARVAVVENSRLHHLDPYSSSPNVNNRDPNGANDYFDSTSAGFSNEYSARKATDPFLSGTSRTIKAQMRSAAAAMDITPKEALEQLTFKGFGESGLRAVDALQRIGQGSAGDLSAETGKKVSAIRNACQRLEQHNLLEAHREGRRGKKVYSLAPDFWARLAALEPSLRTHKLSDQREDRRLEAAQVWTKNELRTAKLEAQPQLERRIEKLSARRVPLLERLHPDLSAKDIERLAHDVAAYKGRRHTLTHENPAAQPTQPTQPPIVWQVPTPRWAFVRDVAGIRADLALSSQPGANWQKEAFYLAAYLDGDRHDHDEAQRIAQGMGIYYAFGADWQQMRSAATLPPDRTRPPRWRSVQ